MTFTPYENFIGKYFHNRHWVHNEWPEKTNRHLLICGLRSVVLVYFKCGAEIVTYIDQITLTYGLYFFMLSLNEITSPLENNAIWINVRGVAFEIELVHFLYSLRKRSFDGEQHEGENRRGRFHSELIWYTFTHNNLSFIFYTQRTFHISKT